MQNLISPKELLDGLPDFTLLDTRSPSEYAHGHIPGAISFPLFSDQERAEVGTVYKQKGKDQAFQLGLKFVGPKMSDFVQKAQQIVPSKKVAIHCWRGGQRSKSMAWLLGMAGFEVKLLSGGYKTYRNHILGEFAQKKLNLIVIGGRTGSGKTKILHALKSKGEQIIDLEGIAHHKGSAFGSIGELPQPTVEQFENDLFYAFKDIDTQKLVWIENESRSIGRCFVPQGLWEQLRASTLYNIEIPYNDRLQNLVDDYTQYAPEELEAAFVKIDTKLGGLNFKNAIDLVRQKNYAAAADIALKYYDKTYQHGLSNNPSPNIKMLKFETKDPHFIADACIQLSKSKI